MMKNKLLHICTVNTKGLQSSEKRNRLIEWSKQQKCDILLLQETHFTDKLQKSLNKQFEGNLFRSDGTSSARGVAIWLKQHLDIKIIDHQKDTEGRLLLLNIEINDNVYTLVNVYAPNIPKNRNTFFKTVHKQS